MARPKPSGNNSATPVPSVSPTSPAADAGAGLGEAELASLLAKAVGGDQEAWRRIVGLYWRRVFALARSRLRDHGIAEEVTQSVFVTVATKLSQGQYAEQGKFEPWLFRVAVNRIRDQVRASQRGAVATDDEVLDARAGAAPQRVVDEGPGEGLLTNLRRCLGMLGDADRQVIELRHHAGMSFAAIADLLDEPLGTLLARHHRALKKLRGLMASVGSGGAGGAEGSGSGLLEDRA